MLAEISCVPAVFILCFTKAEFKREWTHFPGKAKSVVWKYFGFWKIIKQDAPSEM
jgi:hypothetical protein